MVVSSTDYRTFDHDLTAFDYLNFNKPLVMSRFSCSNNTVSFIPDHRRLKHGSQQLLPPPTCKVLLTGLLFPSTFKDFWSGIRVATVIYQMPSSLKTNCSVFLIVQISFLWREAGVMPIMPVWFITYL